MPKLKPLPRRVTIAGTRYIVKRCPLGTSGEADFQNRTIRINAKVPIDLAWETFFHELLHIMDDHTQGSAKDDEVVERFIERVDSPLWVFLRDTFGVGVRDEG